MFIELLTYPLTLSILIKPKYKTVNVVLTNGSVLWRKETGSLDWSVDAEMPIDECMPISTRE